MTDITSEQFIVTMGRVPEQDDMQRANCRFAGKTGHKQCGWCDDCDRPKFSCECGVLPEKEEVEEPVAVDLEWFGGELPDGPDEGGPKRLGILKLDGYVFDTWWWAAGTDVGTGWHQGDDYCGCTTLAGEPGEKIENILWCALPETD